MPQFQIFCSDQALNPSFINQLKASLRSDQLLEQLNHLQCSWSHSIEEQLHDHLSQLNNGNLDRWFNAYQQMPEIPRCQSIIDQAKITVQSDAVSIKQVDRLSTKLKTLMPWRKGPYDLFGIELNTEWRSDFKWARLENHIAALNGKTVLDVGCANGYFSLRMAGAGAKLVVGIDPSWLFMVQYMAVTRYLPKSLPVYLLPFAMEEVPHRLNFFDSVFSMGVLYHRRAPFDHLIECLDALKPRGQFVLETLVIPEKYGEVLVPKDRYARMRNVWFLPNSTILCAWLERIGYKNSEVILESDTSLDEQRSTEWMQFESLERCLDPLDSSKSIEGYPAPRRAIIVANKEG